MHGKPSNFSSKILQKPTPSDPQPPPKENRPGSSSFMKELEMFRKSADLHNETPKKNSVKTQLKLQSLTKSKEIEESDNGSSKKKVAFHLKPSMSETKSKPKSPTLSSSRNCMGALFPLMSSNSPKIISTDISKPHFPYKFYCDGSYELRDELENIILDLSSKDTICVKNLVDSLLSEYEPMSSVSMTLKELILEIKSTPDEELRLLIEDRTDTILEGRSPIRKKNYLSDFKAQLKESSIEISLNLIEDLIIRTQEVLSEYDCVLKVEIEAILASKSTNLLNAFKIFLQKVRIYEETVIYLQDFREEIRKVLGDVTKGIDPELYNEIEKATRSNKIEEFIEFIFKIQLILLKVEKASRFASDLRTQLEHLIKKGYYKAFRIDLQKFLLINKPDSNNLALHRALKGLLLGLSLEKSEGILKNIAEMVINIKKKGHSDLWAKAQLLLLRCNMILYRLGLQNLLKRIPHNEFNQLNFLIMERLYDKSLEDSPEIHPEINEIIESNPKIGSLKFKQALIDLSSQFQFNNVRLESNKPILKTKPSHNSTFLPLNLIDTSYLNESNLDISMSPSDLTEMLEYKEISPKILILESSKSKSVSKQDYLSIWENSSKSRAFHDDIFLNSFSSLCFSSSKAAFPEWKAMKWLRFNELYRGKKLTLLQNISSTYLKGNIETPLYLLNVLLMISDNEFIFKRNFEDQIINDKGLYFVKICQDGVWRYIILDDFLPCWELKKGVKPGFLELMEYEKNKIDIWPLLIVKALAKIYNTYQSIVVGNFADTLRDLTGAPITFILTTENKEKLVETLKSNYERGLLLYVGGLEPITPTPPSQAPIKEPNPSRNHINNNKKPPGLDLSLIYQIVGVISLKSGSYFELTSNNLDLLTLPPNLLAESDKIFSKIKEANPEDYILINTEKSIFMDIDKFCEYFKQVCICNLYQEYFYVARTITHVKNTYCIRTFALQTSSHCFLEVSQVDKRYFRGLDYDYSPVRVLIGKVDGPLFPGNNRPNLKYIGGVYKQERNVNIELNLEKGNYWVLVSFDWRKNTYDATLNYYGEEKILLEKVSYNVNRWLLDDFGGLIGKAYGQKIKLQGDKVVLYFYASTYDCLIVEHLINNLPSKSLYIKRDYSFLDNGKIILLGKYSKMQKLELKVEPMKSETIMFRVIGVESLEKLHILLENRFLNDYKNLKIK